MSKIPMVTIFAIIAAFSGFLFGFDMVVISGADQTLQALWKSSNLFHGMVIMATALWGTVLGSIYGHLPTNKWGRKPTLLIVGILFALSALGSAFASDPYFFAFARFLGGIGIGASTIAAPAYISEIAPSKGDKYFF
jgi:MFS family permease